MRARSNPLRPPDYRGGGLVNLVAELERRLTENSVSPSLDDDLATAIPEGSSYVLVLFDGLGDGQLAHPAAARLREDRVGAIDAPFPSTTTVSLATVATGLSPRQHGLAAYQLWLEEIDTVVNTIKWTTLWGDPVEVDLDGFLPRPNLWERLVAANVEPVTVQPAGFEGSPLTSVLYRGCRFEGWTHEREIAPMAAELAEPAGRLVFVYLPHVDFAAHVVGQGDPSYTDALRLVAGVWDELVRRLPDDAVVVGTSDHGHLDVAPPDRAVLDRSDETDRILYGDPRAVFVRGEPLPDHLPGTWRSREELDGWWGPGPAHPRFEARAPDGIVFADDARSILHRHSDARLIGQHGGVTDAELRIPLLVGGR